jgi:hypothetical protein
VIASTQVWNARAAWATMSACAWLAVFLPASAAPLTFLEDAAGRSAGPPGGQPSAVNLFPPQVWFQPPSPPPRTPVAPAPPREPPPLPFTVKAVWREHGFVQYVELSAGGESILLCTGCRLPGFVREGSTLLGAYRVNALNEQAIDFTYLPLRRFQSLSLESEP